jgi:hypothetical protein
MQLLATHQPAVLALRAINEVARLGRKPRVHSALLHAPDGPMLNSPSARQSRRKTKEERILERDAESASSDREGVVSEASLEQIDAYAALSGVHYGSFTEVRRLSQGSTNHVVMLATARSATRPSGGPGQPRWLQPPRPSSGHLTIVMVQEPSGVPFEPDFTAGCQMQPESSTGTQNSQQQGSSERASALVPVDASSCGVEQSASQLHGLRTLSWAHMFSKRMNSKVFAVNDEVRLMGSWRGVAQHATTDGPSCLHLPWRMSWQLPPGKRSLSH